MIESVAETQERVTVEEETVRKVTAKIKKGNVSCCCKKAPHPLPTLWLRRLVSMGNLLSDLTDLLRRAG